MTRRKALGALLGGLAAVAFISGYFFVLFDPFAWGVIQSRNFTWQRFATVKEGEPIQAVIARLGEPVRQPYDFTVIIKNRGDPCASGGCKEYIFAGARWGASYKEAIVIADRNGRVVHAQARQE